MFNTRSILRPQITMKVTRSSGEVFDLGHVNGWFPWRVWLYRVKCLLRKDS